MRAYKILFWRELVTMKNTMSFDANKFPRKQVTNIFLYKLRKQ